MTNGDRIRSMTDEEIASFICKICVRECCDLTCPARNICADGDNGLQKWIKMEVNEDDYAE